MIDLLQRRRAMMAQAQGGLPTGYTQYDWVQCDGISNTSYILVDLFPNYTTGWTFEGSFAKTVNPPSDYNQRSIFTRFPNGNAYSNFGILGKAKQINTIVFNYNSRTNSESYAGVASTSILVGEWHTFSLRTSSGVAYGGECSLDGDSPVVYTGTRPNSDVNQELRLICGYPCRLARFKVYYQGELVADLVPAMRDADNTAGFYDVVRSTFYAPTGDSTYTCGNGFENFS